MNTDKLVRMANGIGHFFEALPDRGEALAGIADHLQRFWEPRMREHLAAHVAAAGGRGLSPLLLEALRAHPLQSGRREAA